MLFYIGATSNFIKVTMCQVTRTGVDEMKTENYHENHYQQIIEFGRSRPWLPLVGIIYATVAAITLTQYSSLLFLS